jgi:hypothetical protein
MGYKLRRLDRRLESLREIIGKLFFIVMMGMGIIVATMFTVMLFMTFPFGGSSCP